MSESLGYCTLLLGRVLTCLMETTLTLCPIHGLSTHQPPLARKVCTLICEKSFPSSNACLPFFDESNFFSEPPTQPGHIPTKLQAAAGMTSTTRTSSPPSVTGEANSPEAGRDQVGTLSADGRGTRARKNMPSNERGI